MEAADIVVTKREQFATVRQHVRPKTVEAAVNIFREVMVAYKTHRMTGPVAINFSQGALTVIAYDQIARIPDGSEADDAITKLFASSLDTKNS